MDGRILTAFLLSISQERKSISITKPVSMKVSRVNDFVVQQMIIHTLLEYKTAEQVTLSSSPILEDAKKSTDTKGRRRVDREDFCFSMHGHQARLPAWHAD